MVRTSARSENAEKAGVRQEGKEEADAWRGEEGVGYLPIYGVLRVGPQFLRALCVLPFLSLGSLVEVLLSFTPDSDRISFCSLHLQESYALAIHYGHQAQHSLPTQWAQPVVPSSPLTFLILPALRSSSFLPVGSFLTNAGPIRLPFL